MSQSPPEIRNLLALCQSIERLSRLAYKDLVGNGNVPTETAKRFALLILGEASSLQSIINNGGTGAHDGRKV